MSPFVAADCVTLLAWPTTVHRATIRIAMTCYLQDLYTLPDARAEGGARIDRGGLRPRSGAGAATCVLADARVERSGQALVRSGRGARRVHRLLAHPVSVAVLGDAEIGRHGRRPLVLRLARVLVALGIPFVGDLDRFAAIDLGLAPHVFRDSIDQLLVCDCSAKTRWLVAIRTDARCPARPMKTPSPAPDTG